MLVPGLILSRFHKYKIETFLYFRDREDWKLYLQLFANAGIIIYLFDIKQLMCLRCKIPPSSTRTSISCQA